MTSLTSYYNESITLFNNMSLLQATSKTYELAFGGFAPFLILTAVITAIVFIKTKNIGMAGVACGCLASFLVYLGKLPALYQTIPIGFMVISFAVAFLQFWMLGSE